MMTSFPRLFILLVSACQTPAVAVFMPVPSPATMRPTIMLATVQLHVWMIAPIPMIVEPSIICLGRPRMSPVQMVDIAPMKHPMLYMEVITPCIFADGYPNV
jgi:hypothetical protein